MIIFLYGPDSYRRQKRLNKIVEEYRHKYSNLSRECFNLDPSTGSGQDELLRFKEFGTQMLIFDNKKLAILKNVYEAEPENLAPLLKDHSKSNDLTILISEDEAAPEKLKFLTKAAFSAEKFEIPKGENWLLFIKKEAAQRGLNLTSKALEFLAEAFKGDIWGLINELEKLNLFSKNSPLDLSDLKKVGDYPYQSPNIFTFINAVSRNWPLAQRIIALEKLFLGQEEPVKIFNILSSLSSLPNKLIQKLADYDVLVKSGKIDYEEVLIDLALQK